MKIDRHNYEECFILYWDNELTAPQKLAIENFVKENPDLQEEFKIFGETRFTPDNNLHIGEKEFLLNDSFINITNYEDQLLDYIDDELTTDQNKKVKKFAAEFPAIQKELTLLQKTKIQPETEVVFPDKSSLYKREEKVRVISIFWRRVAVAAAIILIAGLVTLRLVNSPKPVNNDSIAESKKNVPANNSATIQPEVIPGNDQSTGVAKTGKQVPVNLESTAKVKEVGKPAVKRSTIDKSDENLIAASKIENKNNLPKERSGIKEQLNELNSTTEAIVDANTPAIQKDKGKADAINASLNDPDVTLKAGHALNIQTPEPDETFESKGKDGGGLKEFLRKTTRVFERRTKIQTTTEDNKLLLGAFAVSLK